jgi:hypothetical protein
MYRGIKVRLAHGQTDDVPAFGFELDDACGQGDSGRGLDALDAPGQNAHCGAPLLNLGRDILECLWVNRHAPALIKRFGVVLQVVEKGLSCLFHAPDIKRLAAQDFAGPSTARQTGCRK